MGYGAPVATIAASASLSNAVDLDDYMLVGLAMPASWTAASITFAVSTDNVTFNPLYDSTGTEVAVTAAAAHHITLNPTSFAGFRYVKVRSGTSGSPVVQTAARDIGVVIRTDR